MNPFKVVLYSSAISLLLITVSLVLYKKFFGIDVRYIKTEVLVDKYVGMKDAKDLYTKKVDVWQSSIDTLEQDYQRAKIKYESGKSTMSSGEQNAALNDLKKQEASILGYVEKIEKKAAEEDDKMTEKVINQMNQFIEEYSKRKGYDIVIGSDASGTLLYSASDLDITEEILKELNDYYLDKK